MRGTDSGGSTATFTPGDGVPAGGAGGRAGFGNLTEEQMAEMQTMTQEERQAFMAEQGIEVPAGPPVVPEACVADSSRARCIDYASDMVTIALDRRRIAEHLPG